MSQKKEDNTLKSAKVTPKTYEMLTDIKMSFRNKKSMVVIIEEAVSDYKNKLGI